MRSKTWAQAIKSRPLLSLSDGGGTEKFCLLTKHLCPMAASPLTHALTKKKKKQRGYAKIELITAEEYAV